MMAQGVKGTGPNGKTHKAVTALDIESLARAHGPTMVKVLRGIANSPKVPPAARMVAANSLLDRGFGKPQQAVSLDFSVAVTAIERRIVRPGELIEAAMPQILDLKPEPTESTD